MSLPKVTDLVGGYMYEWEAEQVKIEVSRVHIHTDGHVSGEITISTSAPGYAPHLHQALFNFSASETRTKLAKLLAEKYKEADWYPILEQTAYYTLDKTRRGEPVIELHTSQEVKPPEFVLEPLLVRNFPTILFGDPGSTKSTISLILATTMLLPWYDNTIGLKAPDHPTNVLFLDYETDPDTIVWQLKAFQTGMGLPEYSMKYRRCAMPVAQDLDQIRKAIIEAEAEVVIIDSVALACGGELKDAEPVLNFFGALRQLKTTSLLLAHTSKERESKQKTPFGSVYFQAQARSIWEVNKIQEENDNEVHIGMFHRKPPPFQKLHQAIGFKLVFDKNTGFFTVEEEDPKTTAEFIERMGVGDRIIALLRQNPMRPKDISEKLELKESTVNGTLKRLKDKGDIVKNGDKYGLVYQDAVSD